MEERQELFKILRKEFPIHDLETKLNTSAEVVLEAIARSSDLTLRGVRGVIAEAAFKENIVNPLMENGWTDNEIIGDQSYDFDLSDAAGHVKIQVKMQRQKAQRPMLASEANKKIFPNSSHMWVVETQRTRGGIDNSGNATRPYRFREFDIIAVSLHPSTSDWSKFLYTVADWLIPDPIDPIKIFKYQPVPKAPNSDWTDNLVQCAQWFRAGLKKQISK